VLQPYHAVVGGVCCLLHILHAPPPLAWQTSRGDTQWNAGRACSKHESATQSGREAYVDAEDATLLIVLLAEMLEVKIEVMVAVHIS